jgi:hypothetical protein
MSQTRIIIKIVLISDMAFLATLQQLKGLILVIEKHISLLRAPYRME